MSRLADIRGVGQFERRYFRGRGRTWGIFFGFYKTGKSLLSDSVNCTVLRAVVLTQYRRVSEGRTDGRKDEQTKNVIHV